MFCIFPAEYTKHHSLQGRHPASLFAIISWGCETSMLGELAHRGSALTARVPEPTAAVTWRHACQSQLQRGPDGTSARAHRSCALTARVPEPIAAVPWRHTWQSPLQRCPDGTIARANCSGALMASVTEPIAAVPWRHGCKNPLLPNTTWILS